MVNTMFIEVGSLSITRIRSFRFREFFFFLEVQLSVRFSTNVLYPRKVV